MFSSIAVLVLGVAAGTLGGAFGIGGAILTTPLLRDVFGTPGNIALGTPLPIIIPTAISGAYVFYRKKMVKYRTALVCGFTASIAAVLAAAATTLFTGESLMLITSGYIAVVGILFSADKKKERKTKPRESLLLAGIIGLMAGGLSGFLGVGGGIVMVPAFTLTMGLCLHDAIGTSLLAMVIYSVPGSASHYLLGNVDMGLMVPIAVGAVVGAQVGSRLTVKTGEYKIRVSFSAFLLLVATIMAAYEIVRIIGV